MVVGRRRGGIGVQRTVVGSGGKMKWWSCPPSLPSRRCAGGAGWWVEVAWRNHPTRPHPTPHNNNNWAERMNVGSGTTDPQPHPYSHTTPNNQSPPARSEKMVRRGRTLVRCLGGHHINLAVEWCDLRTARCAASRACNTGAVDSDPPRPFLGGIGWRPAPHFSIINIMYRPLPTVSVLLGYCCVLLSVIYR